jgi:uncharacterized integral membrane protein (TIGR02327 family)
VSDTDLSNLMDSMDGAASMQGMSGMINILISIVCIWCAWWALQNFRIDVFLRQPKSPQAKLLMIFLSIVIGYTVARFVIDYLSWSMMIKYLI